MIRISTGMLLVIIGIIGLIVPILQGFLLIASGLYLINPDYFKNLVIKTKKRFGKNKNQVLETF